MDTFELNLRLVITGIYSCFGQTAMLLLLFRAPYFEQDPAALSALLPALRHLTRLSELVFVVVSVATIAVHALSQLIVERRVRLKTWT